MITSIHPFMEKLIDYAGLFPPAELPMQAAIQQYHSYMHDQDQWMLGKFVIPIARLNELAPFKRMFSANHPLSLSVIGNRSRSAAECLTLLTGSLEWIEEFRNQYQLAAAVHSLELPLPAVTIDHELLQSISQETSAARLITFCELTYPLDSQWENAMNEAIVQFAAFNADSNVSLGIKLRTGGVIASAFPSPSQVATALAACRDGQVPMKFTAGLHHPIRMLRDEVHTKMHGFLNVFFAGLLAWEHGLDHDAIRSILHDEEPADFEFGADGIKWRQLAMSSEAVKRCRAKAMLSYGSCSFDEPREELRELNCLEQRRG
ncbi:hypothetical protein [Paenibacillus sp. OV219]|uniref:hypothetical protein n=1 Tax=Paenibacillus sp. OV219 TaxID=1884377 RepID=UPI0008B8E902|nr:hypothetical protein [Paenibacillus sp. OV219]SEO05788.1 hypothetical protein SAMN05518847_105372 [Paenibacillus sp. OV219]